MLCSNAHEQPWTKDTRFLASRMEASVLLVQVGINVITNMEHQRIVKVNDVSYFTKYTCRFIYIR